MDKPTMNSGLLDYKQASALLNIKVGTLQAKVSRQEIPHIRLSGRMVRFERSALEAWLSSRRVTVVG